MEPEDYSIYGGPTITHDPEHVHMNIQGDDKSGMDWEEAKRYLDLYPNGTVHNDMFDTDSFITLSKDGNYLFYDSVKDQVEPWAWSELDQMVDMNDPQDQKYMADWWYHDGGQMDVTNGGHTWWDDLRSGKLTKGSHADPMKLLR
jgi:hypothetical protein